MWKPYECKQPGKTRKITLKDVMTAEAFRKGVADFRAGVWDDNVPFAKQWGYERGRLFAAAYTGPMFTNAHGVRMEAMVRFAALLQSRAII